MMVKVIMMAVTVPCALILGLTCSAVYLEMSRNLPGNPETQVLLGASAEEKRPPRKEAGYWRPQFPLLHRGLTPALLSSLQVVVGTKQHSEHVVRHRQRPKPMAWWRKCLLEGLPNPS